MTQPPIIPGRQSMPEMTYVAVPSVSTPAATPPRPARRWVVPLLASTTVLSTAAALFFALGGLDRFGLSSSPGDQTDGATRSTALQQANRNCGLIGELSDNDRTLVLDGAGEDAGSGNVLANDFACVLAALGTPAYVTEQMNITRALDGQQTATWSSFEARWTYHPDAGLNLIIHQK